MKKKTVIVCIVVAVAAVLAVTAILSGVFAAKEKNAASTVTPTAPVATPTVQPTVAPTATPVQQKQAAAMTAEEFYKKLHEIPIPREVNYGASVVITDAVAGKTDESVVFKVPWTDFVRGGMIFGVYVMLDKNDLAKVKVGETVTVKAKVSGYSFHEFAILAYGQLQ